MEKPIEHTNECSQTGVDLADTNFGHTLSIINGKYKLIILYWLYENKKPIRYNELKRRIGNISFKTLTQHLKELEDDHIIVRKEYPQVPPKVEYSLSEKGSSLMPVIDEMCLWGAKNKGEQHEKSIF